MKTPHAIRHFAFSCAVPLFVSVLNAQIPVTTLCDTGRTAESVLTGCPATALVNPINPVNGGPIVDGNWQLATPYPSAPITASAPDPCSLATKYTPAPVNAPWGLWYNPADHLSQWIEPLGGGSTPSGWYIYKTSFLVPKPYQTYTHYELSVAGQAMADNSIAVVYLADAAQGSLTCHALSTLPGVGFSGWSTFSLTAAVHPESIATLLFVVLNDYSATPTENPTGLRVEFLSAVLRPY